MKKYYQAFQAKGTNALKLNFDPSLNAELSQTGITGYLCTATLAPLADTRNVIRCPLCTAVYQKGNAGAICENCQLCQLGVDAVGLSNLVAETE